MRQLMISATAFETIYAEHAADVYRTAYGILRDATLAEDVVQEVFERVWRGSGYDERRGPLGAYLRLLARSRALDSWRRGRAVERVHERLEEHDGGPRTGTHEPEAAVVGAAEQARARAAVRRLPDEQRKAIGLVYWGGLSVAELAAVDGVPLGTAKSRVRLGLSRLSRDPELAAA
jgi:RNA polymerase sigma-70 factor (ECF subfamily)